MGDVENYFSFTKQDVTKALKTYGKLEDDMQIDVGILKEWLRQERHLPQDEDARRLEKSLLRRKCRIEQTKVMIENSYTFKSIFPDLLEYYDLNSEASERARRNFVCVPLPKMTENHERIIIMKVIDPINFQPHDFWLLIPLFELLNTYDYSTNFVYFLDWSGISFDAIKKLDFHFLSKMFHVLTNCLNIVYSKAIYYNSPNYIDIVLKIAKTIIHPKLFAKLSICATLDNIHNIIPKDVLPVEYGGKERSLNQLQDEWSKIVKQHEAFLKTIAERKSDESMRSTPSPENEMFGVDGTFKNVKY